MDKANVSNLVHQIIKHERVSRCLFLKLCSEECENPDVFMENVSVCECPGDVWLMTTVPVERNTIYRPV